MTKPLYARRSSALILSSQVHLCSTMDLSHCLPGNVEVPRCVLDYRDQVTDLDERLSDDDEFFMSICDASWRFAERLGLISAWKIITFSWVNAALCLKRRAPLLVSPFTSCCAGLFMDAAYIGIIDNESDGLNMMQIHPRITLTSSGDLRSALYRICG